MESNGATGTVERLPECGVPFRDRLHFDLHGTRHPPSTPSATHTAARKAGYKSVSFQISRFQDFAFHCSSSNRYPVFQKRLNFTKRLSPHAVATIASTSGRNTSGSSSSVRQHTIEPTRAPALEPDTMAGRVPASKSALITPM